MQADLLHPLIPLYGSINNVEFIRSKEEEISQTILDSNNDVSQRASATRPLLKKFGRCFTNGKSQNKPKFVERKREKREPGMAVEEDIMLIQSETFFCFLSSPGDISLK